MAPVVCSASLVVKIFFSFVDLTGTPLSSGRPLPRESDGSAAVRIVVQRPSSGCKTRRCHPSTRMLREQGRHVIYRHSGCREPAVIYRRPMLPGFGIHLSCYETTLGLRLSVGATAEERAHRCRVSQPQVENDRKPTRGRCIDPLPSGKTPYWTRISCDTLLDTHQL